MAISKHGDFPNPAKSPWNFERYQSDMERKMMLRLENDPHVAKWMKRHGVTALAWQTGYGAFSVSEVDARSACRYIEHQATHHARCSYQEEFRGFLRRSHVDCDERYVWE